MSGYPTREELRTAERAGRRSRVVAALTAALPDLDVDASWAAVVAARADAGNALRQLDEHLRTRPDALTSGDPRCPASVLRLAQVLTAIGQVGVVSPGCSQCHRTGIALDRVGPDGRICQACATRDPEKKKACARCGVTARIAARRDEGGICFSCYRVDPDVIEDCAGCGQRRLPAVRQSDGSALCSSCWTPPMHICVGCGRMRRASLLGRDGPLCPDCYWRVARPRRTCGKCGRHQQIQRRATADSPDLCHSCASPPDGLCSVCGRVRPCTTSPEGQFLCKTCRTQAASRPCSVCDRTRPIAARWPRGPVCGACYVRVLDHPEQCDRCGETEPLIAQDADGRGICATCAGLPSTYTCPACGKGGRNYADGRCPRCVLAIRLDKHLAGPDGQVPSQLQPLRDALATAVDPRGILCWLGRSRNARLLGELAASGQQLSHDLLDELPPSRYEHYVRQVLVHTGALPERHEEVDRIPAWLTQLLADRPTRHAALVRPFVHWFLLRRARRRAAYRKQSYVAGSYLRTCTRVALELLTWLDEQQLELEDLTQSLLDEWLAAGTTRSYTIRYFLTWAARRGLVEAMSVPSVPHRDPVRILAEEECRHQLHQLLNDAALPADVRAAGALVLPYGLQTTHIRQLRADHLREHDGQMRLAIGHPAVPVPPKLAAVLR